MSNDETPKGTSQQGLDDRFVGYGKPPQQTKFKKVNQAIPTVGRRGQVSPAAVASVAAHSDATSVKGQ